MPAVLRQTPATYWAIFDAASRPQFFVSGSDWNDPEVVQRDIFDNPKLAPWIKTGSSLEALARATGLPAKNLAATVRGWNEMIDAGRDTAFHRFESSGTGLPPKIDSSPFYAVQFFPLARKSLGGVAVDLSCRVLDSQGKDIPRLYAVGELAGVGGINGKAALEGTMLGPSILMGRVAAKDILTKVGRELMAPSPGRPSEPAAVRELSATEPETLNSWREVLFGQSNPNCAWSIQPRPWLVRMSRYFPRVRCRRAGSPGARRVIA
jgi:hypothetical protein